MSSVTPASRCLAASAAIDLTTLARPAAPSISGEPFIVALTTGQTPKRSCRESAMTFAFGFPPRTVPAAGESEYQFGASTSTRAPTSCRRRSAPGTAE
jgi:hypothetical protein